MLWQFDMILYWPNIFRYTINSFNLSSNWFQRDLVPGGCDCWSPAGRYAFSIRRLFLALHHQRGPAFALRWSLFALAVLQEVQENRENREWSTRNWQLFFGSRAAEGRAQGDHLFGGQCTADAAGRCLMPVPGGVGCFRAIAGRAFCGCSGWDWPLFDWLPHVAVCSAQHLCRYGCALAGEESRGQVAHQRWHGDLWLGMLLHWQFAALDALGISVGWAAVDRLLDRNGDNLCWLARYQIKIGSQDSQDVSKHRTIMNNPNFPDA